MTNDIAIRIENLGKRYRLGQTVDLARTFRETIMTLPRFFGHKARSAARAAARHVASVAAAAAKPDQFHPPADPDTPPGTFWALRDITFDVRRGETVGIIGRNGAGKSTLLKILSRITTPTTGHAEIRGRVGSLLEVGTGFNPELTGRENIYLNGAILGMRRAEITRKFDEIVAFAETEPFLDTPIKRYSSGMRVRLAFAVAAHLEPEILIVDEVLAVGDAQFQQKCLGKMQNVAGEGRTVLFVSHNMQAIRRLCRTGVLLQEGRIARMGAVDEVVEAYLAAGQTEVLGADIGPEMHLRYPPGLEVFRIEIHDRNDEPTHSVLMDEPFTLHLLYRIHKPSDRYRIGCVFRNVDGTRLATVVSTDCGGAHITGVSRVDYKQVIQTRNIFLHGSYLIDIVVKTMGGEIVDAVEGIPFSVAPVSVKPAAFSPTGGYVHLESDWGPQEPLVERHEAGGGPNAAAQTPPTP